MRKLHNLVVIFPFFCCHICCVSLFLDYSKCVYVYTRTFVTSVRREFVFMIERKNFLEPVALKPDTFKKQQILCTSFICFSMISFQVIYVTVGVSNLALKVSLTLCYLSIGYFLLNLYSTLDR